MHECILVCARYIGWYLFRLFRNMARIIRPCCIPAGGGRDTPEYSTVCNVVFGWVAEPHFWSCVMAWSRERRLNITSAQRCRGVVVRFACCRPASVFTHHVRSQTEHKRIAYMRAGPSLARYAWLRLARPASVLSCQVLPVAPMLAQIRALEGAFWPIWERPSSGLRAWVSGPSSGGAA